MEDCSLDQALWYPYSLLYKISTQRQYTVQEIDHEGHWQLTYIEITWNQQIEDTVQWSRGKLEFSVKLHLLIHA
jgi:hypothetical protein